MAAGFPKVVALSQGDPAGIGPDLALDAWLNRARTDVPAFLYLGDPDVLAERARMLGLSVPILRSSPSTAAHDFLTGLPVYEIAAGGAVKAGLPDSRTATGTIAAIETGVEFCLSGEVSSLATNPIAKSVLYDAGFAFPGHTEFLADLASRAMGHDLMPVMMLAGPLLKAVPVTIHIPLKDVPHQLTTDLILSTCRILHRDLVSRFALPSPRIALAGLNPHAGENGALGLEDDAIIVPAIRQLLSEGIDAIGPLPADTMFHERARATYDVAVCMYHDQALIPAKALGFDDSVNVTLGLPFIRTSPDHGTAFSLAGKGVARPDSLIAALKMAAELATHAEKGLA